MLAANAPDIDIVTGLGGSLNYLHYHRHLTHALAAMPVMALLPVLVVRAVARKPIRWWGAFAAAMIAVASHLLLDLTNVYGIRLLLPFSAQWLRLDLTSVVDLWIWGVLLLAVIGPFVGRLVGSRDQLGRGKGHGIPAADSPSSRWSFCCCTTAAAGCCMRARWRSLDSRIYQDSAPLRVAAAPDPTNPMRWRGLAETGDFYAVDGREPGGRLRSHARRHLSQTRSRPGARGGGAARRLFKSSCGSPSFPCGESRPVPEPENGKLVEVLDMRFGTPLAPGFMVSALESSRLEVLRTWFQWGALRSR